MFFIFQLFVCMKNFLLSIALVLLTTASALLANEEQNIRLQPSIIAVINIEQIQNKALVIKNIEIQVEEMNARIQRDFIDKEKKLKELETILLSEKLVVQEGKIPGEDF